MDSQVNDLVIYKMEEWNQTEFYIQSLILDVIILINILSIDERDHLAGCRMVLFIWLTKMKGMRKCQM